MSWATVGQFRFSLPGDGRTAPLRPPAFPSHVLIEATSKLGRLGCCANAIQRGASALAAAKVSRIAALAAMRGREARVEDSRPRLSSASMRPESEARPKMPTARSSRGSIRIGFLCVIDDDDFGRVFARFELKSEIVLQGGEE